MKKFEVVVKGIVPLLQARHLSPTEEQEIRNLSDSKTKKKAVTDQEQFELHAYRTEKNKFYQPSEMFEAAMTKAAVNFRMEGKKTYKDVMNGGVIISPIEIVHKNQKFAMDARWGKNPTTRGAVWVVRPKVDDWELSFTLDLLQDERVAPETLKQILEYAGLYVGIGAWRPKYGRFQVIKFQEINN